MKKALIVGGNSGIGLSICKNMLSRYDHLYIVGKEEVCVQALPDNFRREFEEKTSFYKVNFANDDLSVFDGITDIEALVITAGFGRVSLFEDLTEAEIKNLMNVNFNSIVRIIKKYYHRIKSDRPFYTAVMGSVAGHVSSPYFSVYGAAKAGLCRFIENINIELKAAGYQNRILDVSPGALKGTAFNGGENDLSLVDDLACRLIKKMYARETLYIPQYDEVYKHVIERYQTDPEGFGDDSYRYKKESGRISNKPQVVVGYLSGTFDLFHIGHLNLLRRAKEQCDHLIVGVHNSGAWKGKETFIPFEERCEIIKSIRFVDKVVESPDEDSDAWNIYHFDKLFVGSDYKGTERFKRYEEIFKDKVEIVYFPYTKGTSSTQLRDIIAEKKCK
ncbi:MAG: SDR family NAD(P)-dependent oxidoreductase [Clostridia bacterium]|nr:SDR family NAD(P)-dependent oxidoreductase [Clostridia bacterium]